MAKNKITFICLAAALFIVTLLSLYKLPTHPLINLPNDLGNKFGNGLDYYHYYATIKGLDWGIDNIYQGDQMYAFSSSLSQGLWSVRDNHPLPFYLLYKPFAFLTFTQGLVLHNWLGYIFYTISIFMLALLTLPKKYAYIVTVLIVGLSFATPPFYSNFILGQVGTWFAGALALTFYLSRKNCEIASGCFLALAVLLKMYPILLLLYFALHKKWRAIVSCLTVLAVLSLWAGFTWGFSHYINYITWFGTVSYNSALQNLSFPGMLSYYLGDSKALIVKLTGFAFLGINVLVLIYLNMNKGATSDIKELEEAPQKSETLEQNQELEADSISNKSGLTEYSLWLLLALIFAPLCWDFHHSVLVIVLISFISSAINLSKNSWAIIGFFSILTLFMLDGFGMASVIWRFLVIDLNSKALAGIFYNGVLECRVPLVLTLTAYVCALIGYRLEKDVKKS